MNTFGLAASLVLAIIFITFLAKHSFVNSKDNQVETQENGDNE